MPPERTPVHPYGYQPFAFGLDFQMRLLKVLLVDEGASSVVAYLRPEYFENPAMRWAFALIQKHQQIYNRTPSMVTLYEEAKGVDPKLQAIYVQTVQALDQMQVPEEGYVKDKILEWVKRNIYVENFHQSRELYNAGKFEESLQKLEELVDHIRRTNWEQPERVDFFSELGTREARRTSLSHFGETYGLGLPELDKPLHGGITKGELWLWLAYWKKGKSTMLMNNGAVAVRAHNANVLHIILEGKLDQLADRYDTYFFEEAYSTVKLGNTPPEKYQSAWQEYQQYKGKLILRSFSSNWDNTVLEIESELRDLRQDRGWVPDVIIVDYLDLLNGRKGNYSQGWQSQVDACRDLKTLANRGYAVISASQANVEMKAYETKEHIVNAAQVAGGKEKLRIVDGSASLNSTEEEQAQGVMRVAPLFYRDNVVGKPFLIGVDAARMRFGTAIQAPSSGISGSSLQQTPVLGYKP